MRKNFLLSLLIFLSSPLFAQQFKVSGKVTNTSLEPLALVSVEVHGTTVGSTTNEEGNYQLTLDEGQYDIVFSIIGYRSQLITLVVTGQSVVRNIILELDSSTGLKEVIVKGRDRAEEIIRNVIKSKENLMKASGSFSCDIYIKATRDDSSVKKEVRKKEATDLDTTNADLKQMYFAEVLLRYDYASPQRTKEERTGVTKGKKADGLFYLSTTGGDFSLYNNLVKVPAVSGVPLVSPVSYSGLLAYRFRTLGVKTVDGRKQFLISVKPRQLSNATIEGEITIADSTWSILESRFTLPKYHLSEYDFFEVAQEYALVNNEAWMLKKQKFTYTARAGKKSVRGQTLVSYRNYQLHKKFEDKYFGVEVSATAQEAYDRDSTFWQTSRPEPLSVKELRYVRYKDSVYTATHTKAYLDSVDRAINKITVKNVLFNGQAFTNHEKETRWYIPPLPSLYQPFSFGGTRIMASFMYSKVYPSKKNIFLSNNISYGIRNNDINGNITFSKLYNPFSRSYYRITLERQFQFIFQGDAWINLLKRNNIYLNNSIGFGHNFEIVNGLFLFTDANIAFRRSVSDYKTNSQVDSLFGDILENNQAVYFKPYNALYGQVRLEYTPRQRYIREPKEKIILGSRWPTFYISWRKGIPDMLGSEVNFDFLETGIQQEIKLGLAGISRYTIKSGTFLSRKDLRLVDYKFQRRGDPYLFLNPNEAFQALDSTFPIFNRFYEAHYVHDFNGVFINKIPLLKKLRLREVAGAGFLIAPERDLRYGEVFAGIEKILKWPFNPLTKFKLGVYIVGSAANRFSNPPQFKIGITTWDKVRNKWF